MSNISKEPYKGVRDFFPEDYAFLKYLYRTCAKVAENYGYTEYGASPLEPSELFAAKTGDEIIGEQTYSFEDRGGRRVTLRPEMTPTLSRMVASRKRELSFPLRWFSFPNLFRYEQPQRGRLREHYQFNVDLFGIKSIEAEIEVISIGSRILKILGAKDADFRIYVSSKNLFSAIVDSMQLESVSYELSKLIDKKHKLEKNDFETKLKEFCGSKTEIILSLLEAKDLESFISSIPQDITSHQSIKEIEELIIGLNSIGVRNIEFRFDLMRGFDYYTGIIFEFFDTDPLNNRSLFGGGRYDELLSIFDEDTIPAVGFGMGDVTARDFLETHGINFQYKTPTDITILTIEGVAPDFVYSLADSWREKINVSIDWSDRKLGDKIKMADKNGVQFVFCAGEAEMSEEKISIKNLQTGNEYKMNRDEVSDFIVENNHKTNKN